MAPFNLSEFAHKELKIPGSQLAPVKRKSYVARFLIAHVLDFWALLLINLMTIAMYQGTFLTYMQTSEMKKLWHTVNFTPMTWFACLTLSFTYFFCSYFLNHGQSPGMKLMKCRLHMREHHAPDALIGALRSIAILGSMGIVTKRFSSYIVAHDHLWHSLMIQKDIMAPDVRTLATKTEKEIFAEAA